MALASLQTSASASLATVARYAISNVHLGSGVNPASQSACAEMGLTVIHSMASAYAQEVGLETIVTKNVLLIAMGKIAVKSVVADTVEVVITFLESVFALPAILGLSAIICVHLESTATSASRNANVKTVVPAMQSLENAIVLLAGSVQFARIGVQKVSGVRIAQTFATVTTELRAIILKEPVNANLVTMATSV